MEEVEKSIPMLLSVHPEFRTEIKWPASIQLFELTLADSTHWPLQAQDDEAAEIVGLLGSAMMLQPGQGRGRRLYVVVDGTLPEAGKMLCAWDHDPVVRFWLS